MIIKNMKAYPSSLIPSQKYVAAKKFTQQATIIIRIDKKLLYEFLDIITPEKPIIKRIILSVIY